jgi:geranylgeranyl diphosphate synthase type II
MISSIWSARNIWEGKRTVMLIDLIERCSRREKRRVVDLLSKPRSEKTADEVEYVFKLMKKHPAWAANLAKIRAQGQRAFREAAWVAS